MPKMSDFFDWVAQFDLQFYRIFITFIVILFLMGLQRFFLKYISRKKWDSEKLHLKIHTYIRNFFLILITLAVIIVWIPQIQSFAISIAAIAVAIVVSVKEVIAMFTGGLVRSSTDLLSTGDRIEINGLKGDVVRVGFFTTDLLEVRECGQRTGRVIHIPNNFFFTYPVFNESSMDEFCFHVLILPIHSEKYSVPLKDSLLDFTKVTLEPYVENASKKINDLVRKSGMSGLSPDPRALLQVCSHEKYNLILRIVVPVRDKIEIEQKIIQKFTAILKG